MMFGSAFGTSFAGAQEFTALGGVSDDSETHGYAGSWQVDYKQSLSPHFSYSLSLLNEGKFDGNHRDGVVFQLWGQTRFLSPNVSFSAGIGPYFFFDTNKRDTDFQYKYCPYKNEHGVAAVVSFDADWYFRTPFFLKFRTNWVWSRHGMNTSSYLLGLGLQLDPSEREVPGGGEMLRPNQLSLLLGKTIMNNRDGRTSNAVALEYRRRAARYLEWTVSYLNEGNNNDIYRDGVAAQLWGVRDFCQGRLSLGIGLGPYFAKNNYEDHYSGKRGEVIVALLSAGVDFRVYGNWSVRGLWSRVITDNSRDSDIVLVGPSYHF